MGPGAEALTLGADPVGNGRLVPGEEPTDDLLEPFDGVAALTTEPDTQLSELRARPDLPLPPPGRLDGLTPLVLAPRPDRGLSL